MGNNGFIVESSPHLLPSEKVNRGKSNERKESGEGVQGTEGVRASETVGKQVFRA